MMMMMVAGAGSQRTTTMMRVSTTTKPLSLFCALCIALLGSSVATAKECDVSVDGTCRDAANSKPLECGVYMAPSTLGEDTNMGIYTGIPLKENDVINYPEIVVPLLFREWGDHVEGYDDGVLWDRYIWEGDVADIESYVDTDREKSRAVFVPGVGCTINSVLDMKNIESTHGSVYDTCGLHRSKDPGAGAFTPYHSSKTTAVTDVAAGSELFADYGDYWIPDIPGAQITFDETMDTGEDFLRREYYPFIEKHQKELNDELKEALWKFTASDFPIYSKEFTVLPRTAWADVENKLREHPGEDWDEQDSVIRSTLRQQYTRSIDWLNEHGYCQDHLKPGRSTIPQAGRGAFATRRLPKGTVVGYAPLVHVGIHGRDIFEIGIGYDDDDDDNNDNPSNVARTMYDMVVNYSFGHRNSTVMLTPYGSMVNYINHDKERANVKVRWPDKELIAHKPDWLEKDPYFLRDTVEKIGLSFEYVALRDIEEGEEIFMDYGDEWEEAWQEHVAAWKPADDAHDYVHSSEWKEDHFRTRKEQKDNPYPSNLITMCQESYRVTDDGSYEFLPVLRPLTYRVYCNVLARSDDNRYTVELDLDDEKIIVKNYAKDAIFLYDEAFSADWHLPNVFRHEIMIPDDIMPEAWLNGPHVRDPNREFTDY